MSEPKAPTEFASGEKVLVHQSPVRCEVIRKLSENWLEVISEDGKSAYRVPVQFASPEKAITLILTREQAEDLMKFEDIPMYLFEKLEEKLK
jgi:hypothetical protein